MLLCLQRIHVHVLYTRSGFQISMQGKRNQHIISNGYGENSNNVSGNVWNHRQAESHMSLSQWLHPSLVPRSYVALLNENSASPENTCEEGLLEPLDVAIGCTAAAPRLQITHTDAANYNIRSEQPGSSTFPNRSACKVKPSVRVESRVNHEFSENCEKEQADNRSFPKFKHPSSQTNIEKSRTQREQSGKDIRGSSQSYRKCRRVTSRHSNTSKSKSYSSERERKQRIEDNIKAFRELLPNPVEDNPESILNEVVAHVKLLQLQIKELSRNRLGGEPTSHPLIFIEGYGHYIHHEQTMNKPLEEIMAEFLATDPDAATCLLESKGLHLMPLALVEGFSRAP